MGAARLPVLLRPKTGPSIVDGGAGGGGGGGGGETDYQTATGLYLPGASGEYVSTPDHADLDITGDLCLVTHVAADDWTPGANATVMSKWDSNGVAKSYLMNLAATSGYPRLYWSVNGSSAIYREATSAPSVADGEPLWVAATLDVDNGASGHDVKFWTSADGATWAQLGTTVTTAGVTSIYNNVKPVELGTHSNGGSSPLAAAFYYAAVYDGIGDNSAPGLGTLVYEADFSSPWVNGKFTDSTGKESTINGTASAWEYQS